MRVTTTWQDVHLLGHPLRPWCFDTEETASGGSSPRWLFLVRWGPPARGLCRGTSIHLCLPVLFAAGMSQLDTNDPGCVHELRLRVGRISQPEQARSFYNHTGDRPVGGGGAGHRQTIELLSIAVAPARAPPAACGAGGSPGSESYNARRLAVVLRAVRRGHVGPWRFAVWRHRSRRMLRGRLVAPTTAGVRD
jgi:hypothetical protein